MVSCDKYVLVGVQSPFKIKPPADCRGAQMYYVMQSMTRTSQQVRRGVLEYDVDQWDGSKDLYGMLQWSEDEKKNAVLKEYVPNYRINLIDAGNLEHLERFKSDLQEVLGMIQCRGDKENLLKYINDRKEYFQNVDEETYYVIREFLHS